MAISKGSKACLSRREKTRSWLENPRLLDWKYTHTPRGGSSGFIPAEEPSVSSEPSAVEGGVGTVGKQGAQPPSPCRLGGQEGSCLSEGGGSPLACHRWKDR